MNKTSWISSIALVLIFSLSPSEGQARSKIVWSCSNGAILKLTVEPRSIFPNTLWVDNIGITVDETVASLFIKGNSEGLNRIVANDPITETSAFFSFNLRNKGLSVTIENNVTGEKTKAFWCKR